MTINNNITILNELGQSIWYDNLSRDVLNSGQLEKLINQGISGLTSNPSIFKKAIADSKTYDDKIKELAKLEKNAEEIVDLLMLEDVKEACKLLLPIYNKTQGRDGFASLEVSPLMADNTEKTILCAKKFWEEIDHPNLMVKVPATEEGMPAIQKLISLGINVNVTLIFSLDLYEKVIDSYLAGLKDRLSEGKDISKVSSVASFFISRNDVWYEKNTKELDDLILNKLGLACGFSAYQLFTNKFASEEFQNLAAKGANIQRILWASTSVKNPELNPLLYATGLPYNNSVATHPPALIELIIENAIIKKSENKDFDHESVLNCFEQTGKTISEMHQNLLEEGVEAFKDAYLQLILAVKKKILK